MKILVTLNTKSKLSDGRLGPIMTPFEAEIDFLIENLKENDTIIFAAGTKKLSIDFLNKVKETNTKAIQENKKEETVDTNAENKQNNNKNKNNWKKEKYNNNNATTETEPENTGEVKEEAKAE